MLPLARYALIVALPLAALAACGERSSAPPPGSTTPPASQTPPPPANPPPASTSAPVPPQQATDVDSKKGPDSGMVGGASGDVASGGKPGSGVDAGGSAGQSTSPTKESSGQTDTKK